jgi:hypothetical protein
MNPWNTCVLLIFGMLCSVQHTNAQLLYPVTVRGKVVDKDSRLALYPASVRNLTAGKGAYTDRGGYFRIAARQHDTIIIKFIGYLADTFVVKHEAGEEEMNREMLAVENMLNGVTVKARYNAYQIDSLERLNAFGDVLALPDAKLISSNVKPQFGIGLVFSPFSRFSQEAKKRRRFKKMYATNEHTQYIAYRFSNRFVANVTGLTGDSLLNFMYLHMPGYEQLRAMNNTGLVAWTTEQYHKWTGR